jgi:hypothetical protein
MFSAKKSRSLKYSQSVFPQPVSGKMLKDEPVVYIFEEAKKIYCAFFDQPKVQSRKVSIREAESQDEISIVRGITEFKYVVSNYIY